MLHYEPGLKQDKLIIFFVCKHNLRKSGFMTHMILSVIHTIYISEFQLFFLI